METVTRQSVRIHSAARANSAWRRVGAVGGEEGAEMCGRGSKGVDIGEAAEDEGMWGRSGKRRKGKGGRGERVVGWRQVGEG